MSLASKDVLRGGDLEFRYKISKHLSNLMSSWNRSMESYLPMACNFQFIISSKKKSQNNWYRFSWISEFSPKLRIWRIITNLSSTFTNLSHFQERFLIFFYLWVKSNFQQKLKKKWFIAEKASSIQSKNLIPSIGVTLRKVRWNCTGLNFKYLYKSHCKSCELLWAFKGYSII
jgi:hypothetical protein